MEAWARVALLGAFAAAVSCSNDEDRRSPSEEEAEEQEDARSAADATVDPPGSGGRPNDGGLGRETGGPEPSDASLGTLGDVTAVHSDVSSPQDPLCPRERTWSGGVGLVDLASTDPQILLDVTPDERTLVWYETQGNTRQAWIADRASAATVFGAPRPIPAVDGYDPLHGMAVSPDGRMLVLVARGGEGLAVLRRDDRGQDFEIDPFFIEADAAAYDGSTLPRFPGALEFEAANLLADQANRRFTDPAFGGGTERLYFTGYTGFDPGGEGVDLVVTSSDVRVLGRLADGSWAPDTKLVSSELRGTDSRKRVSSLSSDELTLFYWDEAEDAEYAIWRETPIAFFGAAVELGDYRGATPNQACSRLYFSRAGELRVAEAN